MRCCAITEHEQPHWSALAAQLLRQLGTDPAALRSAGPRRHRQHGDRDVRRADLLPQPARD
jgi:hypothetical protein